MNAWPFGISSEICLTGVDYEDARTLAVDGWNARTLHLYSHAGTHMNAQTHFEAGPETIDRVPSTIDPLLRHGMGRPTGGNRSFRINFSC